MDILLVLALIWGYNNQPKDVQAATPVATTFNQAVGFECQSNCTTTTTTEEQIIAELEAISDTTTVTATSTITGTSTSTSTSTGT
jgi:hypothetical protein